MDYQLSSCKKKNENQQLKITCASTATHRGAARDARVRQKGKMDCTSLKKYLFKLFVMEMVIFGCAALIWLFRYSYATPFYICLFISGAIFTGIGTLFYFSVSNEIRDDYQRRVLGSTSMTHAESGHRALEDIILSYFQASLFLWPGLIAAGVSFASTFT